MTPHPPPSRARLLVAAALAGVAAGIAGDVLTLLLHLVRWIALGPALAGHEGVAGVAPWRRIVAPALGGALAAAAWWRLRRPSPPPSVPQALRDGTPLPAGATWADAATQILAVGAGLSVGREGAPRQAAAACADAIARRLALPVDERRALIAAAAGAGLAAVYNVPLAGVAFAVEVLGARRLIPAVIACALATVTAWPVVGMHANYVEGIASVPHATWAFAVLLAPLGWLAGRGFAALSTWARSHAPAPGWRLLAQVTVAGATVGALSCWVPELPGNGKGVVELALAGAAPVWLLLALAVIKPVLTALTLGSGATGGVLTPALATGAALGAACALTAGRPDAAGAFALVGAVAVLGSSERAPVFAALMGIELLHPPLELCAVLGAVALVLWVAARLRGRRASEAEPARGSRRRPEPGTPATASTTPPSDRAPRP